MKNRLMQQPFMLVIYGPTGVGKTDFALDLAQHIPAEIINMDMGQFYTPLSIGTAKPDWQHSTIPHHLFDIINEPQNFTVAEYRQLLYKTVNEVIARGNLPILVGGSGFYLHSLLFSPGVTIEDVDISDLYPAETNLWEKLYAIDPKRALSIDKNDHYRIQRALAIWHATGKLPSSYSSSYDPQADYMIIFVERDRQELKERINARVLEMFKCGWIEETENLIGTAWQEFIQRKNLIGYNEIFDFLLSKQTKNDFSLMVELISAQTRQYAKRQFTFWRKLEREIKKEKQYNGTYIGCLEAVNITNTDIHMYISEVVKKLSLIGKRYE